MDDINNSLMSAVRHGELEKARQLIESYGLHYSKAWSNGYNLLRVATETRHKEITKLLLLKDAKVNSKNSILHPSNTPLHFAVRNGDIEVIQMLIEKGAMINLKNEYGNTPLYDSLEYNELEITKLLLNRGANINDRNNNSITPLHIAIERGCLQTVEYLLSRGACVNPEFTSTLKEYYTPLHFAILKGNQEIAKLLLKRNADVNAALWNRITSLHLASIEGHSQIIEDLLNHGAAYTVTEREGYTPLHLSVERGRKEVTELLLDKNADVNARSIKGVTPLHIASKEGHIQIAEYLLNHGAAVNCSDGEGYTSLHFAVAESRENVVKLLLNKGADIEVTTKNSLTPLYIAIEQRNEKLVKLLLEHGANVEAQTTYGKTVLHAAVEIGNSEIVKHILNYCPDINNEGNRRCLYFAVVDGYRGYETIVRNLLKYGFAVNPEDANDSIFFHAASELGYIKIIEDLLMYGTDVNILSNKKYVLSKEQTPLHSATKNRQTLVAALLINHGASVNAKDGSGKTPLVYAIRNCDLNITKLLLANGANIKDPGLLSTAVRTKSSKILELLLRSGAIVDGQTNSECSHIEAVERSGTTKSNKIPLHIAAFNNNADIVEMLLEFGAELDSKDGSSATALHMAAQEGHVKVVRALLNYCPNINMVTKYNYTPFNLTASDMNVFHDRIRVCRSYDSEDDTEFFRSLTRRRLGDVVMTFEQHIVKMEAANLYICKENLLAVDSRSHDDFRKNCKEEIENLKTEKIANSNVSFYDILTKSASQLAVYARNENIIQVLKSNDFRRKFPIYSGMINGHLRKGVVRKELLEYCNRLFRDLVCFPELPYNCVEKIFSYLNDKELRIFIDVPIRINKDYVVTYYYKN